MYDILSQYEGEVIGINLDKPLTFQPATLAVVNEDFISIDIAEGQRLHYASRFIVFAKEGEFSLGGGFSRKTQVSLLVQVYQFVVYRGGGGSIGVGMGF